MPGRITLQITDMRAERLNCLTGEDAFAEGGGDIGIVPINTAMLLTGTTTIEDCHKELAKSLFIDLWDHLNSKRGYGWTLDPGVWVISFRRVE